MSQELKLRDYQYELCRDVFQALDRGDNKVIAQSPTGSGKNFMMGYMCSQANKRGGSAIFTVAGRNVVSQFTDSLDMFTVPWTYVMSGEQFHAHKNFYVSSVDTLQSWFFKPNCKYDVNNLMKPDYLLVDEMRLACTQKRGEMIDHFANQGTKVIGFDATPKHARMHLVWNQMIQGRPTPWHIDRGNLAYIEHYCPSTNDEHFMTQLQDMKASGGDYKQDDLAELMDKQVLVGEIVSNYEKISMQEYGDYKPFLVACVNKKHARSVEDAFLQNGHKVEYVDADTSSEDRMAMFKKIEHGEIVGIISVLTMIYGVDLPPLHICINARPTKSLPMFLQLGGRILRQFAGNDYIPPKSHAVMIDHAGAVKEHGYLDDVYTFSLDPDEPVVNETQKEREQSETPEVDITCSNCNHTYKNSPICPKCGHEQVIDFDQHNVVYVNTELVRQHKEGIEAQAKNAEDWKWLSDMKAAVWANPKLMNDGARINVLNSMCRIKFKSSFNPVEIMQLQAGQVTDEAKRYYKHFNIRQAKGYRRKG